jgi:hypothetical protein
VDVLPDRLVVLVPSDHQASISANQLAGFCGNPLDVHVFFIEQLMAEWLQQWPLTRSQAPPSAGNEHIVFDVLSHGGRIHHHALVARLSFVAYFLVLLPYPGEGWQRSHVQLFPDLNMPVCVSHFAHRQQGVTVPLKQ